MQNFVGWFEAAKKSRNTNLSKGDQDVQHIDTASILNTIGNQLS